MIRKSRTFRRRLIRLMRNTLRRLANGDIGRNTRQSHRGCGQACNPEGAPRGKPLFIANGRESLNFTGGVHGSRLARGNACGEQTVAMQWEQKLAQGYRTSRAKFKVQVGTAVLCVLTPNFQALCREHSKATRHGMARTKAHTTLRSTQANRTQSTVHQRRFNRPPWRSTFGRGQRNGYV